jgi:hypothetical protein
MIIYSESFKMMISSLLQFCMSSATNRNEYQESSWGKGWPARKADNLTAIC